MVPSGHSNFSCLELELGHEAWTRQFGQKLGDRLAGLLERAKSGILTLHIMGNVCANTVPCPGMRACKCQLELVEKTL